MKISAVLFDLDGVIVDTAKFHFLAWKRLAESLNIPFTEEDNERLKGVSRRESLSIILSLSGGEAHYSPEELELLMEKKNQWYIQYIETLSRSDILPGFMPVIAWCRETGRKTAIVSASKNTETIVNRLGIRYLFDAVIDGNRVTKVKPDPEGFLLAAHDLHVSPGHCLVIEDAAAGIRGAVAAGMHSVGIGDPAILVSADIVVPSLDRLDTASFENR